MGSEFLCENSRDVLIKVTSGVHVANLMWCRCMYLWLRFAYPNVIVMDTKQQRESMENVLRYFGRNET